HRPHGTFLPGRVASFAVPADYFGRAGPVLDRICAGGPAARRRRPRARRHPGERRTGVSSPAMSSPAVLDTIASYLPAVIVRRLVADPTPLPLPAHEEH